MNLRRWRPLFAGLLAWSSLGGAASCSSHDQVTGGGRIEHPVEPGPTIASGPTSATKSASNMIELKFNAADGPILIQICAPVSTPESKWPWTVEVRTNGRSQMLVGEDPLEALEMAIQFTAAYLSEREGLDPFVKPPVPPAAKIS